MATSGGTDLLQRDILGQNHTVSDLGQPITQRNDIVAVGSGSSATGTRSVCLGFNASDNGKPYNTIVGPENTTDSVLGTVVGYNNQVLADFSVVVGTQSVVAATSGGPTVTLGMQLNTDGALIVNAGFSNTVLGGSSQSVVIGSDLLTAINCNVSVLIGRSLHVDVAGGLTGSTLVGSNIAVNLATKTNLVLLGQNIATTNSNRCIAVGNELISNAATSATRTILIGSNLTSGNGTDVTLAGYNNTVSGAGVLSVVVLGRTISTTDASYMVILGDSISAPTCSRSVLEGSSISVTSATPAFQIVAVGYNLTLSESNGSVVLANIATVAGSGNVVIGNGVQMQGGGGSGNVLIGQNLVATDLTAGSVAIGQNSIVASSGCVVLHGTVRDTSPTSVCVNGMIYSRAGNSVVIGGTANDDCANSTLVGVNSSSANTRVYGTALGYQASVTGDGGIAIGAFAASPAHQCTIGTTNPVADIVRLSLVCSALAGEYFAVYSTPVASDIGLIVPHHNGVSVVAKQVKTSVTPPVGSLLLYIDP